MTLSWVEFLTPAPGSASVCSPPFVALCLLSMGLVEAVWVCVHRCACTGMCVQVCVHGYACTGVRAWVCVQVCVYGYACTGVRAWVCVWVCVHRCACAGVRAWVCVHRCACAGVCGYVRTGVHVQVCVHGYACTGVRVQVCVHGYTCIGVCAWVYVYGYACAWVCVHDSRFPSHPYFSLQVDQSGLGLPSRDYYLNKTENEKVGVPLPREWVLPSLPLSVVCPLQ